MSHVDEVDRTISIPVMFCIIEPSDGEVSILGCSYRITDLFTISNTKCDHEGLAVSWFCRTVIFGKPCKRPPFSSKAASSRRKRRRRRKIPRGSESEGERHAHNVPISSAQNSEERKEGRNL